MSHWKATHANTFWSVCWNIWAALQLGCKHTQQTLSKHRPEHPNLVQSRNRQKPSSPGPYCCPKDQVGRWIKRQCPVVLLRAICTACFVLWNMLLDSNVPYLRSRLFPRLLPGFYFHIKWSRKICCLAVLELSVHTRSDFSHPCW